MVSQASIPKVNLWSSTLENNVMTAILNEKLPTNVQHFIEKSDFLIGVDEAGAGTWAGDLVVASCILDPKNPIDGLADSKKLSEKKREALYDIIKEKALDYAIVRISPREIERSNILACRMNGMRESAHLIARQGAHVLVDGDKIPEGMGLPTLCLVKGDDKVDAVRAASILAKVARDRDIVESGKKYPEFGFERHKGYGTKIHKDALDRLGPTKLHRFTYKPVRNSAILHGTPQPTV